MQSDQIAAPKEVNRTPNRGATMATNNLFPPPPPPPIYNPPARPVQAPQQPIPYVVPARQGQQRHMSQSDPSIPHSQQTQESQSTQTSQFILPDPPVYQTQHSQRDPQILPNRPAHSASHFLAQATPTSNSQISGTNLSTLGLEKSRSLVIPESMAARVNWIEEFSQFFDLTLTFARNFGNVPSPQRDSGLTGRLIMDLQEASHPQVLQDLLNSSSTRYHLVAAVMNQAICKEIFRSSAVRGFSSSSDARIGSVRRMINSGMRADSGVKDSTKRGLLQAAADIFNEMRDAPGFKDWVEIQIEDKASNLWDRIKGLLSSQAGDEDVFGDLCLLYREAYRISLMMFSIPLHWNIEFPQNTRQGSFFDPTTMINRDARFREDPVSLRERCLRIRLGINPIIIVLDYMDDALLPRTVHYADVLLQT